MAIWVVEDVAPPGLLRLLPKGRMARNDTRVTRPARERLLPTL